MITGSVTITGAEKIEKFFEDFSRDVLIEAAKPVIKEEAERALAGMQQRVKRGLYFTKGLLEFSNYRAYERALVVTEQGGGSEWVWRVGLPAGAVIGGVSGDLLSRQIEYGTSSIAPMPHVRPLHLELTNDTVMRARVTASFVEKVDEWLRSKGLKSSTESP